MESLQFATGNTLKFEETKKQLEVSAEHMMLTQLNVDIPELQSNDPLEILYGKVGYVRELTGEPFIVDDTSFDTERFPGFPGSYAKFTNQTLGKEGLERLFEEGDIVCAIARIALCAHNNIEIFEGQLVGTFSFNGSRGITSKHLFDEIMYIEGDIALGEALNDPAFMNHRRSATDKLGQRLSTQP